MNAVIIFQLHAHTWVLYHVLKNATEARNNQELFFTPALLSTLDEP